MQEKNGAGVGWGRTDKTSAAQMWNQSNHAFNFSLNNTFMYNS